MNKKKLVGNIIKIVFSLLFIFFLFSIIDVQSIAELYGKLSLQTVLLCTLLYLLINILRTARFCVLARQNKGYVTLTAITLTHGIYNRILPLRLGEGIYPYLMQKHYNMPISESVFNILIVRLFDLLSTAYIFCVVFVMYQSMDNISKLLAAIAISLVFIFSFPVATKLFYILKSKAKRSKKNKLVDMVFDFFDKNENKITYKNTTILFMISTFIWIVMFTVFDLIFMDFGLDIPTIDTYFAGSFSNISSILPISSFGNFGTMELGWSGILVMLGYENELSILSGVSANLFTFSCTVGLGLIGMVVLKFIDLRKKRDVG